MYWWPLASSLLERNPPMLRFVRFGALASVVALALVGGGAVVGAQPQQSAGDVVGHVYVNDNSAGVNSISGFDRHDDGTLTPIAGSPFAIGGAGTGAPTGSQ